ncbi:MAG: hypothetical protein ACRDJ5_02145, partial [Actinomycetota bacterium]
PAPLSLARSALFCNPPDARLKIIVHACIAMNIALLAMFIDVLPGHDAHHLPEGSVSITHFDRRGAESNGPPPDDLLELPAP